MLALRRCFASRALSMRAPLRFIHTPPAAVTASLQNKGIRASEKNIQPEIVYQPSQTHIYEYAVTAGELPSNTPSSFITNTGALANFSGEKMGRVPNEKRVVKEPSSEDNVWWGNVNKPMTETAWKANRTRGVDFLNTKARLYVLDGFVNWDKEHQIRVRIVTTRPYHCAFMRNMLIMPSEEEMIEFEENEPDFYVFNAGEFSCDLDNEGMTTKSSVNINLGASESMILGTEYAGEMKKGIFSVMHYLMPLKGVVSLHASCNEGPDGDTTLLFGLSGTGKTTLSADPTRKLIGDDEHCWDNKGVFNIEGGCYAKCINLTREAEPEIYDAVRYGAVLENVIVDEKTREVDFFDVSLTENTRLAYPIEYIPSAKIPCVGGHPKNIIFLTCDAFGVLPPVSKLSTDQLMYQFISGYTAKVAGTEVGITDPEATFSACFGAAFLMLHPTFYADLLAEKLQKFECNAWLVNTGWSGGAYGVGERMSLKHTRRILDGIHDGSLENATMETLPIFDMQVPTECAGVPSEILMPINTWEDKDAYVKTLNKLAEMFVENFEKYSDEASEGLMSAAPVPNFTEEFTAEVISRGSVTA